MSTHPYPLSSNRLRTRLSSWKAAVASVIFSVVSIGAISVGAAPATWVVDDLTDGTPAAPHNTLRTAVVAAASGDFIEFSPDLFIGNVPKTLTLTKGVITFTKDLTIVGPGDAPSTHVPMLQVEGNGASRIFQINSPAIVTISGLGMRKGIAAGGGGVLIAAGANLNLLESDLTDCTASGTAAGGAILNQGSLTMDLCLVARNKAYDGGGIASTGKLQVTRSLILANVATNFGGGIHSGAAAFTMESSTVSGNKAGTGGGLVVITPANSLSNQGTATLTATTVAENKGFNQAGGLYVEGPMSVAKVGGSLFTNNLLVKDDDDDGDDHTPRDLAVQKSGKITSADYNVVSNPGSTFSPYGDHDQVNVSPQLGVLAYNGGRTQTYLPSPTSLTIDRGNPAFAGTLVPTDQRGFSRVSLQPGGIVDVGAVELSGPVLTLLPEFVFECTGLQTTGVLNAGLTLAGGGVASVTWTINGVSAPANPVTVPDTDTGMELTRTGQFNFGNNSAKVKVVANSFTVERSTTVTVKDTTAPVISVNGPSPAIIEWGTLYIDAGATVSDACDSAPILTVTLPFPANTIYPTGTFSVIYKAADSSGNSSTATRVVSVVDTIKPVISLNGSPIIYVEWGTAYAELGATASDNHDGSVAVSIDTSDVKSAIGAYQVRYNANDGAGNHATEVIRTVIVRDTIPPVISLNQPAPLSVNWGAIFTDPGATARDNHDGPVDVLPVSNVNTCIPGQYDITYVAQDSSGNKQTTTRVVTVLNTVSLSVSTISQDVDPSLGTAGIDLAQVVSGVQSTPCGSLVSYNVTITKLPGKVGELPKVLAQLNHLSSLPTYQFPAGTSSVRIEVDVEGAGQPLLDRTFSVQVADPNNVTLPNVAWPLALDLPTSQDPINSHLTVGSFQQMIARSGESRWFKIHGTPGSRITVALKNLPANFDLVVYSDIRAEFNQLMTLLGSDDAQKQKQALLGAQSSQEAYLQEAYLQEAYLQEAYLQEAYLQEAYLQEAYLPDSYFQEAYLPETYSQEAYLQEAYLQEAYLQEAYLPEAFSSAQLKSLVSFSAAPGTADENVRFNTYSRSGDFYIRVRGNNGLYSLDAPFELEVKMLQDLAANITDQDTTPALNPAIAGAPTSLLLWDSVRIPGADAEKTALASSLATFAAAANGVVIDVATDARISALNAQADANTAIPLAKNLVAETIRNLIQRCRATAPTIRDITLIGSDNVIPFFRKIDSAQLAGESNYYPPVKDGTHSQSSLRLNQVLTQDRYGSSTQISLATGPYDMPGLPVGRLVENASEVQAYLTAYTPLFNGTATSGTLPTPHSAFVSGYEFLADSAAAMRDDFAAGLGQGATMDTLISPANVPPAQGWNADQLRAVFLGSRHDIAYIGGHFSGGGTLAADYKTRMTAKEMDGSTVNLQYSVVLSTGCHSGYNTIDGDSIAFLTEQPDWAQAFSRKKALWISGTGYQYGDTDFVEYTERLQLEVARALRTGSGPVSIGQALNNAKRRYLTDTAVMRGIHEKTLIQLTLYGLPMMKINVAGVHLAEPTSLSDVASTTPVSGVGHPLGLKTGDITLSPIQLTRVDRTLGVLGTTNTVVASYFTGSDGFISVPGEPVRALESLNVSRPGDGLVRGIGFRGGDYTDATGFLPFIGVPVTESSGIHGRFYTEVFYPVGIWSLNQAGELGADSAVGSKLNVFPTQFMSDGPESTTGILRKFGQLQFTVFYCPNVTATALANAPALNNISTQLTGAQVSFAVEAATAKEAGVQEVWITYTGLAGSPYYGKWRSLTLTAPANAAGIGTWTGALPLGSAGDAAGIRYMVQAVNGVGAVVQSTNFGRFYTVGSSTQDAAAAKLPVNLALANTIAASAAYRTALPVQAQLTDPSGLPLAGRMVRFSVGPAIKTAATDSNGVASTTLTVNALPGSYQLEASFAGDTDHANATDSRAITVTKQGTKLTPMPGNQVTQATDVYFDLSALDGSPVGERTVVLLLKNAASTVTTALAAATDNLGRLRLTDNSLRPGTYTLTAFFAQPVVLPTGETVPLDDPLYGPSKATFTFTISAALRFNKEQAWLNYSDKTAPGATSNNRGLARTEITGEIKAQSTKFKPKSILVTTNATSVWATIHASMSGKSIANGPIKLSLQSSDRLHWRASSLINGISVQLYVDWEDDGDEPGKYHVWINTPPGSGPLYGDTPAVLQFELILGTGTGEHPIGGTSTIGGSEKPWTQQTPNSRVRTGK